MPETHSLSSIFGGGPSKAPGAPKAQNGESAGLMARKQQRAKEVASEREAYLANSKRESEAARQQAAAVRQQEAAGREAAHRQFVMSAQRA